MLYARVTLRIKREETESDSKVVLYRGDYNIDIEFTLESTVYILSESAYAQLIITRPYADSIFSQLYKITNDTTTIRITRDMIDELNELEIYSIQIRLFDENRIARVTIPPCYGVIHVKNPIASEPISDDVAKVNLANVNYNTVSKDYEYTIEEIFTDEGVKLVSDYPFKGNMDVQKLINLIGNFFLLCYNFKVKCTKFCAF